MENMSLDHFLLNDYVSSKEERVKKNLHSKIKNKPRKEEKKITP